VVFLCALDSSELRSALIYEAVLAAGDGLYCSEYLEGGEFCIILFWPFWLALFYLGAQVFPTRTQRIQSHTLITVGGPTG